MDADLSLGALVFSFFRVRLISEMEEQQFILRWHYHEDTLLNGLPFLLESNLLTDITLSVGCNRIRAHRVVLATCSSYFLQLFQDLGPIQHPVIVLHDIDYNDINAIVSFMYKGHCTVAENQLPRVLATAKSLQVRGLCDLKVPLPKSQALSPADLSIKTISGNGEAAMATAKDIPFNAEPMVKIEPNENGNTSGACCQGAETNSPSAGEAEASGDRFGLKLCKSGVGSSRCFICGKYLSNQYNLRVHMETHEESYHACTACPHVSRSRDALRKHISYRHPEETTLRKKRKGGNPL